MILSQIFPSASSISIKFGVTLSLKRSGFDSTYSLNFGAAMCVWRNKRIPTAQQPVSIWRTKNQNPNPGRARNASWKIHLPNYIRASLTAIYYQKTVIFGARSRNNLCLELSLRPVVPFTTKPFPLRFLICPLIRNLIDGGDRGACRI